MSPKPRNKKIAALLAGASLLTIAAGARASAATQIITGAQTSSVFILPPPVDRVIITNTANVPGDVINQTTIGSGNDPNPVEIDNGAVITGAFINEGQIHANDTVASLGNATALAAGIFDTAPGVPRINNTASGVISATAKASASALGGVALAGAGGVVQIEAVTGPVSDTVTNAGQISAHATANALGLAAAGGVGVLQAQLATSGHQDIANTGSILGQGIASGNLGAASTAAAAGVGALQAIAAHTAAQTISNGTAAHISGLATAHASQVAVAAALGAGQVIFADNQASQLMTNNGLIHAHASAVATNSDNGNAFALGIAAGGLQVIVGPNTAKQTVVNHGTINATAVAKAKATNGSATAIAGALGVGQVIVDAGNASQIIHNSGSVITAQASATATDSHPQIVPEAIAVAAAFGGVQVIAGGASNAFQSATNGSHAVIGAQANANANGTSALAVAVAGGVGQVALFVGSSTQLVVNSGSINATAHANANALDLANADAVALGVEQIAIATNVGTASVVNNAGASIDASARASAGSTADPASAAVANAAALGVNQVVLAGNTASANMLNGSAHGAAKINASAFANAYATDNATANAVANGVGQIAIAGNAAVASVFNESEQAVINVHASANAAGFTALANAAAVGVGQVAIALAPGGSATANVHNQGIIDAIANANAIGDTSAVANALANGVGQVAIGSHASASVWNQGGGPTPPIIHASAQAFASAQSAEETGAAVANAAAVGVGQLALGGVLATATVHNQAGQISATAGAHAIATGQATANAFANGVGQAAIAGGATGFASASVFNQGANALIKASANANATGFSALANAAAVGVGQVAVALAPGGVAVANVDNEGAIEAFANAKAFGATATANGFATGVGQIVIAGNTGTASVVNNAGASIDASARASAGSTADPASAAVANAAALGVNQVVLAGNTASANMLNGSAHGAAKINASAFANAYATDNATANAVANGVGQIAIAGNAAVASVFNESEQAVINVHASANAAGFTALANAAAVGVGQVAIALAPGGSATANVHNQGIIDAIANANAIGGTSAVANALANGVGQVAIGSHASASVWNQGGGPTPPIIHASAQAFASANSAVANATAGGVGQLALGGVLATATVHNQTGQISATAGAHAIGTEGAVANALALGIGQAAIAVGTSGFASASVFNQSVKALIKASANANATATGAATANAAAVGVGQLAVALVPGGVAVAHVDNEGAIDAIAGANASGFTAIANAVATGLGQAAVAFKTATASLTNSGSGASINANAHASAFAASGATAVAAALGVGQLAAAGSIATASVVNYGKIDATAKALASGATAHAVASATGVSQVAAALGSATAVVKNYGGIGAYANASAFGPSGATAVAEALGVGQFASGVHALASVVNSGSIHATATAVARGSTGAAATNANAVASATGVKQVVGPSLVGSAFVNNSGTIGANAKASAVASTVAVAVAGAFGVSQAVGALTSARATVNNAGQIKANAGAFASAFSALAIATATGVKQQVGAIQASASVTNVGFISGNAHATAHGFLAQASASARGVAQSLSSAFPLAVVANSGTIQAAADANARGFAATALAVAVGVSATANTPGTFDAEITNNGVIRANATANASATATARASAFATGIFVATNGVLIGNIVNNGSILASAFANGTTGTARAIGINDPSAYNDMNIVNTGLIRAYAQASGGADAFATGIRISGNRCESDLAVCGQQPTQEAAIAPVTTITNAGGTIWAGWSTNGGQTIYRGDAINTYDAPNAVVINLQGGANGNAGHIYGDIYMSDEQPTAIEVTNGTTFFEGTISSGLVGELNGSLNIDQGGKLVLCQEGWQNSCDPGGWGNANWDPQSGLQGPSMVYINTFTVGGDGTIVYQLTPNTDSHPQVFANQANLGGTLVAQYLPGFYANNQTYDDLIVAGNAVGGANSFNNVKDNSLLLNTTVIYDGNTVDLNTTRTDFNAVKGLTKNEHSAATGIEDIYKKLIGKGNPASTNSFDQLVASLFTIDNKTSYAAVLDQLSGAQYAQQLQSVLWSLRPLDAVITDRMDCSSNHPKALPGVPGVPGYSYQPGGCFIPGQLQTWGKVWGGWNNNNGDIAAPGYNEQQWGIWGGGDYALSDRFTLGLAGGYFRSNMDFQNVGGVPGGTIEYSGGQIAGYAAWDTSVWYNRAIVSGGFYSGESHRDFSSLQSLSSPVDPSGSPDADVVSFYNEAGRRFFIGYNSALTPFAGVTVAHAELNGFTESDHGTGAALKVSGSGADSLASILGLRLSSTWGLFTPEVALGWEHEFDDTSQTVNVAFAGAPSGSNFKTTGTNLGEDTFVVDAGAGYSLGTYSDLSVRYVGRFLQDYDLESVMGRWTYKFYSGAVVAAPVEAVPLK